MRQQHDAVAHGNAEQRDKANHGTDRQGRAGQHHGSNPANQRERQVNKSQQHMPQAANRDINKNQHPRPGQQRMQDQVLARLRLFHRRAGEFGIAVRRERNLFSHPLFKLRHKRIQIPVHHIAGDGLPPLRP